jgi:Protein of unknown function (DUF664)/Carboxyl transferase domain
MAETQREPVPRVDSGELDTALAFLSFARHCVLKKADGLSDEQLRRVLVDSGTSILGLVQHLAEAERYWFDYHLAGAAWDADREYGMTVPADRAAADVLRDYRAAIEDSDRAIVVAMDRYADGAGAARPGQAAYWLARRAIGLADRIGLPLLTLVGKPGAEPGPAAEHDGIAAGIAATLRAMTRLRTPSVART